MEITETKIINWYSMNNKKQQSYLQEFKFIIKLRNYSIELHRVQYSPPLRSSEFSELYEI